MARPRKTNADYFPHDAGMRNNIKIKALINNYGLEGYAVFVMMLETLCGSPNFRVLVADESYIELLAGDFHVSAKKMRQIIEFCVKINLLQIDGNVLSNSTLTANLSSLVERRKTSREWAQNQTTRSDNEKNTAKKGEKTGVLDVKNGVLDIKNGVLDVKNTTNKTKENILYSPIIVSSEKEKGNGKKQTVMKSTPSGVPTDEAKGDNKAKKKITLPTPLPTPHKHLTPQDCDRRREIFRLSLDVYRQEYGDDTVDGFYCYWAEKTPSGVQMRWEKEKTWETRLRLITWARREREKQSQIRGYYATRRDDNERRKAESLASIADKLQGAGIVEGAGVVR